MIEALPQLHIYVKEMFVLQGKGIDTRTNDFFDNYFSISKDKTSKIQLGKYLQTMNITPVKTPATKTMGQHYRYFINREDLHKVYIEKKWIDASVDHINEDYIIEHVQDAFNHGVQDVDMSVKVDYKRLYEELQAENERLKQQITSSEKESVKSEEDKQTKVEGKPNKVKGNVIVKNQKMKNRNQRSQLMMKLMKR